MRTVTADKMRALDKRAIEEYGIPSIVLMENAGLRTADCVVRLFKNGCGVNNRHPERSEGSPSDPRCFADAQHDTNVRTCDKNVLIVCGTGNNGGDGFVIARHLINKGCQVRVVVCGSREHIKNDPCINLIILERMKTEVIFTDGASPDVSFNKCLEKADYIVDALFGTGLSRAIEGTVVEYIEAINKSAKPVIAVDIPSGVNADTGAIMGCAIHATMTVTMAAVKNGLVTGSGKDCTGELIVVDISIPKELIEI